MDNPKVSIIVPIYRVEEYIERCAESLFAQTFDDIEYIPPRQGIQLASGDYTVHCDSDDWMDVHAIKELYTFALSGHYDMVFYDFYRSDGVSTYASAPRKVSTNNKDFLMSSLLCGRLMGSLCGALIKRSLYDGITFPRQNMNEDLATIIQLVWNSRNVGYLMKPFYYYFFNPASITSYGSAEIQINKLNQRKENLDLIFTFLRSKGIYEKYTDEINALKVGSRMYLDRYMLMPRIRRIWHNTYPEINSITVIRHSRMRTLSKIEYFGSLLGVYPIFKYIKNIWKDLRK